MLPHNNKIQTVKDIQDARISARSATSEDLKQIFVEKDDYSSSLTNNIEKNIKSGGSIFNNNDYYLRKSNDNPYYCICFPDKNTSSEDYYNDFIRAFNNLPDDQNFSKDHFNNIQNWLVVNHTLAKGGKFLNRLVNLEINALPLLLIGWGEGAKHLWQYLTLNKLPIILLDPVADNNSLEYYNNMSDTQRNMTIINSNCDNFRNNKLTRKTLYTIENSRGNFDGSVIKQPGLDDQSANHNLIGQPLFNNSIIIKAYDSVLQTDYYNDNVKPFDLSFNRYVERFKFKK